MYILDKCNKHYFIRYDYIFLFGNYLEMITNKGPVRGPRSRFTVLFLAKIFKMVEKIIFLRI